MPTGKAVNELQVFTPVLTNLARTYRPKGRIYGDVTTSQSVDKITDQYITFDERYFFSNVDNNQVADRSPLPELELSWSTDNFTCLDYGFKYGITPRELQQSSGLFDLQRVKTYQLMDQMANQREKRLAALLRKTGTGNGALTSGAGATTAFATSTAIESDWETAKTTVYNLTGLVPNVAIVPYAKAVDMSLNTTLRDINKYFVNSDGYISLGENDRANQGELILPRVFHGTRIIVPTGSLAQTGHEGAAKSLSDVWGTSVRFLYVPEQQVYGNPATVYSFSHPVLSSDNSAQAGSGPVVHTWQTVDPTINYVGAEECLAEKIVAPDTGYELTGT